jgi:hypothetical protein
MSAGSYFERDGDLIIPTEYCGGAWDPQLAAGQAVTALLAHGAEGAFDDPDLLLARLTMDLLRPAPVGRQNVIRALTRHPGSGPDHREHGR